MSVAFASEEASRGGSQQTALALQVRPPAVPAAVSLLKQAKEGLVEAGRETDPVPRFVASYLSALRAAAAILAARGRPHRGKARPESVWTLLGSSVPELEPWAAFFAAHSARHAAAQAGATRRVGAETTRQLYRGAGEFVLVAQRTVHEERADRSDRNGGRRRVGRCGAPTRATARGG